MSLKNAAKFWLQSTTVSSNGPKCWFNLILVLLPVKIMLIKNKIEIKDCEK